ncbi:MAG TPA: ATP-dependent Clp protease ATP-binding subunit [Candidatus Aminicenantes bacterium]|nr:ATP-dependent Clp protease ATP-binding subunit [Candidatus Aminicenantes bacterium]
MTLQVSQLKNTNEFRQVFFPDLKLDDRTLNWETTEELLQYDIHMLDALIRAESLHKLKHYAVKEGVALFDPDPVSALARIRKYLARFDSKLFLFGRSERQTFGFVLENLGEYLYRRDRVGSDRERQQLFRDYRFWAENFFTILDQKLTGMIVQVDDEEEIETERPYLRFESDAIRIPLYPFVLIRDQRRLFLERMIPGGLEYLDITEGHHRRFTRKDLDIPVFTYLCSLLDIESARLVASRLTPGDHELTDKLDLLERAISLYADRAFPTCLEILERLSPERMHYPLLVLMKARCHLALKQFAEMRHLLQKFVLFFPFYADTFELMGDASRLEGKFERAVGFYEKFLRLSHSNSVTEKVKAVRERMKTEQPKEPRPDEPFLEISPSSETALPDLVGREREIRQMMEILISGSRSNILLVGESGVGRSALISALSRRMVDGDVPGMIEARGMREINFLHLLAGAKYRGQFEEKALKLLNDFSRCNDILVLEDIHLMMSPGGARGTSLDLVNILKPFLRDGSIQVIATTNYEEMKNTVERDHTLMGYLQSVQVSELSNKDIQIILRRRADAAARDLRIDVKDGVLEIVAESAGRHLKSRRLPLSALLLLERCFAKIKLKVHAGYSRRMELTEDDVTEALADILNLPQSRLSVSMNLVLSDLPNRLSRQIVGQDNALRRLSAVVTMNKLDLGVKSRRPDGVFLFVGPTGVGKTETALALARALYGSEDHLIRIDMSEYMERFTYSRFVGAAPGYVGYQDTNQLTDRVRQNPFSIILLDEVEKADAQLLNIFLQVFDAGRLTDARGNVVDFSHTTFIMTSNIGTSLFQAERLGFQGDSSGRGVSRAAREKALRRFFTPEFLNRVDEIVYFRHLDKANILRIIELQLEPVRRQLQRQGKCLVVEDGVLEVLAAEGYSLEFGARNLTRVIQNRLLEPISRVALGAEWANAGKVECVLQKNEIVVNVGINAAEEAVDKHSLVEKESVTT